MLILSTKFNIFQWLVAWLVGELSELGMVGVNGWKYWLLDSVDSVSLSKNLEETMFESCWNCKALRWLDPTICFFFHLDKVDTNPKVACINLAWSTDGYQIYGIFLNWWSTMMRLVMNTMVADCVGAQ